ncbi:hypothetical protein [Acidovorax sp. Leaf78]|uniref:hypothetical protein n=1 Tax=Acidovorax sp. Leaf78 TaxID=1736237 RepID=UPI000B22C0D9|nr:hypothetical protein [Acidovorax sp. Leaf78]
MTEFVRPGPLGTNEHDSNGEFSKIRLHEPSHSFIGKGHTPTPLGTHSTDAESRRSSQRYPAPARSMPSDSSHGNKSQQKSAPGVSASTSSPAVGDKPHWGNEQSLKRIADTDEHVRTWLRAALSNAGEYQTPGLWLAARREEGLDRYDNNLAAAERFAMAAEGFWNVFPGSQTMAIAGKKLLQKARMNVPGAEALLGKAGSSNPDFTEKWGQLGNSYHQLGMTPQAACEAAMTHKFSRK